MTWLDVAVPLLTLLCGYQIAQAIRRYHDPPLPRSAAAMSKNVGHAPQPGADGAERNVPGVYPDHWVTVCSACRCASCWHGEFMCQLARDASTVSVLASTLRTEDREHPSYFSVERLREVCGDVRYATRPRRMDEHER